MRHGDRIRSISVHSLPKLSCLPTLRLLRRVKFVDAKEMEIMKCDRGPDGVDRPWQFTLGLPFLGSK